MKTLRMTTLRILGLLSLVLVVAIACKREEPATTSAPVSDATPASQANPVDATAVVDSTPAAAADAVDSKAIAGSFSDGESILELRADGSYVQTLNAGGGSISSDGSWAGSGSKSLLLDPNSKSAQDVIFDIVSNDELRTDNGTRIFRRVTAK